MRIGELIVTIVVFVIAGGLLLLAVRHFMRRGLLLNNVYLKASAHERKAMNPKPYYRQSAIVFSLLSAVFLVLGLSFVMQNSMIALFNIPLLIVTVIYAVISHRHGQK